MDKKKFSEVFTYTDENKLSSKIPIVIPMIQRDYAQGRSSASEIRKSFVKAIHKALIEGRELNLDFVYGSYEDIDGSKAFVPLDGQQRLTTLFLLYWLVSKRENIVDDCDFIERFTYKTRHTTRAFCDFLSHQFIPRFKDSLSSEIMEDPEFILLWENDPTVKGMLVMLDELNDTFYGANADMKYWDRLPLISFFFANLDELGVSDEIYIKMNSRGKPLTPFEHFKAELDGAISNPDFSEKIDTVWTDVFWNIRKDNGVDLPVVDESFLRYFHFIADIICYKKDGEEAPKDDFEMIRKVYSDRQNQELFEKAMDVWVDVDTEKFFSDWFVSDQPSGPSFRVNIHQSVNLLKNLCRGEEQTMRSTLILWGCVTYLMNTDKISKDDFRTRIRVLRNLALNSENEYRKERYRAMITETEELILSGAINLESNSFNQQQKEEEAEKLGWIEEHDMEHELRLSTLENNNLLLGSTCLIGTENYDYFDTFNQAFDYRNDEDAWIELSRALLTYGDISYKENYWRVLIPGKNSSIWRKYLGPNTNANFRERANYAITSLLNDLKNGNSYERIIQRRLDGLDKFDWRYYIVKYPVIIKKSAHGKYWFPGETKSCHFYTMHTPLSTGGRNWEAILLALSDEDGWILGDYGNELMLEGSNTYLANNNQSAIVKEYIEDIATNIEEIEIPQSATPDSDAVDRVEYLKSVLARYRQSK